MMFVAVGYHLGLPCFWKLNITRMSLQMEHEAQSGIFMMHNSNWIWFKINIDIT